MKKSIIKNYVYNLSYQVLLIVLPLITTPYLSRVLGANGLGTYSYTNSITQYFILFGAIGLNLYSQREIAYFQSNKREYSRIFFEIVILKALCLLISIFLFYQMSISYHQYTSIFLVQTIDIVASIFDISWFYQGIEDFKKIVVRNFITKIIGVVSIFLFVKSTDDLLTYVFLYSCILLIGNLSMWGYIPKIIDFSCIKNITIKRHIKPAILLFIPQISISLYTILDKTMIGFLTGIDAEVSYYDQSQKIVKLALTIITSVGTIMMPRIANSFAKNDNDSIMNYMDKTLQFVFVIASPIMCGLMAITNRLVPWFFGPGFDKVILNMIIISPIILIIGLSNVIGVQYLLPTGKQRAYTTSVIIGSLVNFILNFIFIPHLLSLGAAIATLIAEASVTIIQLISVRNIFNLRRMFKMAFRYLILSSIMMVIVYITGEFINDSNLNVTVIQIAVGALVYSVLLLLIKDSLIIKAISKLKKNV